MRKFLVGEAKSAAGGKAPPQAVPPSVLSDILEGGHDYTRLELEKGTSSARHKCRQCKLFKEQVVRQGKAPHWSYLCNACNMFENRKRRIFKTNSVCPQDWGLLSKEERDTFHEQFGHLEQSELCAKMKVTVKIAKEQISRLKKAQEGNFYPLSYYKKQFDLSEEQLQKIENDAPAEYHPLLGKTYKVDIHGEASIIEDVVKQRATWMARSGPPFAQATNETAAAAAAGVLAIQDGTTPTSGAAQAPKEAEAPVGKKRTLIRQETDSSSHQKKQKKNAKKEKADEPKKKKPNYKKEAKKIISNITPLVETMSHLLNQTLKKANMKEMIPEYMMQKAKGANKRMIEIKTVWSQTLLSGKAPDKHEDPEDVMKEIAQMQQTHDHLAVMVDIACTGEAAP